MDLKQEIISRNNDNPVYYYIFAYDARNNSLHHIQKNITELTGTILFW